MTAREKIKERPSLSILALVSFIASFIIARAFTTLNPTTSLIIGGYHVHHFWFGLAMLTIGGWIGISYQSERIDRLAAIIFGAGGGLVGDEIGLLLTLEEYWTEITYSLVIVFVALAAVLILINRYRKTIQVEFAQFLRSNFSLYIGVFLLAVSIAFLLETDHVLVIAISGIATIVACLIILASFAHRIRIKWSSG
jgi:hypothetical protein